MQYGQKGIGHPKMKATSRISFSGHLILWSSTRPSNAADDFASDTLKAADRHSKNAELEFRFLLVNLCRLASRAVALKVDEKLEESGEVIRFIKRYLCTFVCRANERPSATRRSGFSQ